MACFKSILAWAKIASLSLMFTSNKSMVAVVSAIWDWREEMVSSQSAWLVALALSASAYCPST